MADRVGWEYSVTGLDGMIRSLEQVSGPISYEAIEPLNKVAVKAFAITQANAHVITGKMKASGRLTTTETDRKWQMKITYIAMRNKFNYAYYEMMREGIKPGHGPHDYFLGLDRMVDKGMESAMNQHIKPMKG